VTKPKAKIRWNETIAFAPRVNATARDSWWTKASAPDQREQFMADWRARQKQKSTDFIAGYTNAAGEADK
jgi:hypothetical protein